MTPSTEEPDYQRRVTGAPATHFLLGTGIEIVRELGLRMPPKYALFDFDGTLSLIREGWPEVMIPMMVRILKETGTAETADELTKVVTRFVMELNGKQTIYQMIRLAEEIRRRGGQPVDPQVYKQEYHDRLLARIDVRRAALRSGATPAETMMVPGSVALLTELKSRGVELYLASGTDERYVKEEVALLKLDVFFGPHVYGAVDDYKSFSKQMVIERILRENKVDGDRFIGFGDGFVEIDNVKGVGGVAIAVASDEAQRSGRPDPWKRERLIGVGADIVVPDYRHHRELLDYLWTPR
ncbi:MAG TPA: HAD family hydrolase [Gemmataceae bacterium]|jgi:phosphoglycolate phosphatase-like HAD superfamily hydrolase|nr:HAD family hydrolase [Gemmataceae bacterium]